MSKGKLHLSHLRIPLVPRVQGDIKIRYNGVLSYPNLRRKQPLRVADYHDDHYFNYNTAEDNIDELSLKRF